MEQDFSTLGESSTIETLHIVSFQMSTAKAVYITLVMVTNLCCNSFAIFIISKAKKGLQRQDVKLVLSLFVSDLLYGFAMLLPAVAAWNPYLLNDERYFETLILLTSIPVNMSVYNLAAIAVVKMLSITRPLQFETEVSPYRIKLLIAAMWTAVCLLTIPVIFSDLKLYSGVFFGTPVSRVYFVISFSLVLLPGFSAMFLGYGKIFFAVIRARRQIEVASLGEENNESRNILLKSARSAKSVFIITVTFLVVYFLSGCVGIMLSIGPDPESELLPEFVMWWGTLPINSFMNSIIYIVLSSKMRKEAVRLLFCRKEQNNHPETET